MVVLWLWERSRLAGWDRGERLAFWLSGSLACAWAIAYHFHTPLPTFPGLTRSWFAPLWQVFLLRRPDPFW